MISCNIKLETEGNQIQIVPLGDFHLGDENFKIDKLIKTLEYIQNTDNCYTILNGDLMNNALKCSKSDSYKEQLTVEAQQDWLIKLLEPIKDKILYMAQGNHEYRTSVLAGIDPLRYVAKALGLLENGRYSDNSYVLNVQFGANKNKRSPLSYVIYGIHGSGTGGRRMGSTVNCLEEMTKIIPNANLYVHSHTHVPINYTDRCFVFNTHTKQVEEFKRTFVNTNSFQDYGGYAERYGYKLTDLAPFTIIITYKLVNNTLRPTTTVVRLDI